MLALRLAGTADAAVVFPYTRALNDHEGIEISDDKLRAALVRLLANESYGCVWLVESDGDPIGHAIVTYGYDLEYGGRDSIITELWIDPARRNRGIGGAVLDLLAAEMKARGVAALHLQVRPENPAMHLYERSNFVTSPRRVMTRKL